LQPQPGKAYELGLSLLDQERQILVVHHKILDQLPSKPLSLFDVLESEQFPAFLSCSLRDLTDSSLSHYLVPLTQPEISEQGMGISSLVLLDPAAGTTPPIPLWGGQAEDAPGVDPFALKQGRIRPGFQTSFQKPERLEFFFRLHHYRGSVEDYDVYLSIVSDGKPMALPAQVLMIDTDEKGNAAFLYNLGTKDLGPGTYTLYIKVMHREDGDSLMQRRDFVISAPTG
jgi:hypothetical protein